MIPPSLVRPWRVATLFLPTVLAWALVLQGRPANRLALALGQAMLPLSLLALGGVAVRFVEGLGAARRRGGPSPWSHLDLLTANGAAILWTSAAAIVAAQLTGWASLAVLGMLGSGVVYATAIWTTLVAGGSDPFRGARVERAIEPAVALEGDPLREEIRLTGVRIPTGFSLLVEGGGGPSLSRHGVGSDASAAEVVLESHLGPARRGEHHLPPLSLWLQDALGLCRTPTHRLLEHTHTVLPRPARVDGVRRLLGEGGDQATAVPARRLPSEGWFRLREYQDGDDTRRIHWLRSLRSQRLVVRLPDEVPPEEPAVRLILDSYLFGVDQLRTPAPGQLLDAMVRIWLGAGAAIAADGTRVTLVAAARSSRGEGGAPIAAVERPVAPRSLKEAQRLGAAVAWQSRVPVAALLGNGACRRVVVSSRPRPEGLPDDLVWLVVPEAKFTEAEPWPAAPHWLQLPFPLGTVENRFGRRLAARQRAEVAQHDGAIFDQLTAWSDPRHLQGSLVARPVGDRVAVEVIR